MVLGSMRSLCGCDDDAYMRSERSSCVACRLLVFALVALRVNGGSLVYVS